MTFSTLDWAREMELRPYEVARIQKVTDEGGNSAYVYKCGICGEIGSFIGQFTHAKSTDRIDKFGPFGLTRHVVERELDKGYWCAGRPDLMPL